MKLDRALEMVGGVTEEDVIQHKVQCQGRSYFGNSYLVVKIADIYALKRKLEKEKKEAAYQALVEEHGEAKAADIKQQEEEAKRAEAAAKKAAAERQSQLIQATGHLKEIFQLSESPGMSLEGELVGKTAAKSDWGVKDYDLEKLESFKEGRLVKYELKAVIGSAVSCSDGYNKLKLKIAKRNSKIQAAQFAGFLYEKRIGNLPKDLLAEAQAEILKDFEQQAKKSKGLAIQAQQKYKEDEDRLAAIKRRIGSESTDENAPPAKRNKA